MKQPLTYGMVGGGPGSMIGVVHRRAIALDGKAMLVSGVFSRDPEKSRSIADTLSLAPDRVYADYAEMARQEAARPDGIDFVVIVTPNDSHFAICKAFLNAGIHVVCDKPVTVSHAQALELEALAREKDLLFMVTYTYTGYSTVKYARELVRRGEIGDIRMVMAEYPQGWLAHPEDNQTRQGQWRCDPARSGGTNCLGDIGIHAQNLVSTVTGLKIRRVLAKMDTMVLGRVLDDNDSVLVEYDNGASGINWSSQVAIGCDNGLRLRIFGTKGTILWFQETHEKLTVMREDGTIQEIHRGHSVMGPDVARYNRTPAGHSEGYVSAMANLYLSFLDCLEARREGRFTPEMVDYPTIESGAESLAYVEACLESSRRGSVWVTL